MGRALIFNEQGFFASVEGFCDSSLQTAPGGEMSLQ